MEKSGSGMENTDLGPGMKKSGSRIWDKYLGSATLLTILEYSNGLYC
jgi:hypothetical protein